MIFAQRALDERPRRRRSAAATCSRAASLRSKRWSPTRGPGILGEPARRNSQDERGRLRTRDRAVKPGVRVYPARMDGFDASYTEGEDHVLLAMVERSPTGNDANSSSWAACRRIERAEIRLECRAMGLPVPSFLPDESALNLPPIGEKTVIAPVHPYLYQTCAYAARERGAPHSSNVFPTARRSARVLRNAGRSVRKSVSYEERERGAWASCEREVEACATQHRVLLRRLARAVDGAHAAGRRSARSVRRDAQSLQEVSRARVAAWPASTCLEAPDRFAFSRVMSGASTMVRRQPHIAKRALRAMGFNVKWSTELTFQPIRGFRARQRSSRCRVRGSPPRRIWPRPASVGSE